MRKVQQHQQVGCHADLLLSARLGLHDAGPGVHQCHFALWRRRLLHLFGRGVAAPRRQVNKAAEHLPPARAADRAHLHHLQPMNDTVSAQIIVALSANVPSACTATSIRPVCNHSWYEVTLASY